MKSKQTYKILTESQAQGFFEALHFLKTIFCFYAMHLLLKDKTVLTISRSVALELALLPMHISVQFLIICKCNAYGSFHFIYVHRLKKNS